MKTASVVSAALGCLLVGSVGMPIVCAQAPEARGLPSRTTTAVTYEARRTTKVDLVGTPLAPRSRGEAEIATEAAGPVRIKAKVRDLIPPAQFGSEYLTFVAWAIPPQGRGKNLGELRVDDGESEIEATSDVQTFALIITAEPYYAVTTPSDVVVMENAVRADTRGRTSVARLEYEIVPRGAYVEKARGTYSLPAPQRREPGDVQQARNAVAIARIAEAERLAASGFATAQRLLTQLEQLVTRRESQRDIVSLARATAQAAEEARLQAVERASEEAEAALRAASATREQAARAAAAQEAEARRAAEAARAASEQNRIRAEELAAEAAQERQRAEAARQEAERARAEAEAQTARAEALRAHAEQDQAALRGRLLRQFGEILETRDTARGLIVNVGDVLFETGRFELRAPAREKLARFAGIVLGHPDLTVQVEGFTDSTGTAAVNERLSQQRADAVASFLLAQGLSRERVTARGFGASDPVADNATATGRQQNRRVELVVSGSVIGTPLTTGVR